MQLTKMEHFQLLGYIAFGFLVGILDDHVIDSYGTIKAVYARNVPANEVLLGMNQPFKSTEYVTRPMYCALVCLENPSACKLLLYTPYHGKCDIINKYFRIKDNYTEGTNMVYAGFLAYEVKRFE